MRLSKIYNQSNTGACPAYSAIGLFNTKLKKAGIDDEVDPLSVFNLLQRGGVASYSSILDYGKNTGFTSLKGKVYKIKMWGWVPIPDFNIPAADCYAPHQRPATPPLDVLEDYIKRYDGLLFTYKLHSNCPTFQQRLDPVTFIVLPPDDGHDLVICEYDATKGNGCFLVANSWGDNWGDHGYFYLPAGSPDASNFIYFSL